ncbi:MAG: carbohydrate-binding domain-containing protein [Oscillospiraceae bacterium]|nr:carbohydrate-binding domain-containing protein [Oscillospiraceae bacterium]
MRKFFAVLMVLVLVLSFGACGSDVPADRDKPEIPEIAENPEQKELYPDAFKILLSENGVEFSDECAEKISVGGDIVYYRDIDEYESKNPYGEGEKEDKHTEEEAKKHTLITIKEPGEYILSGSLFGQVAVDLGENAKNDPNARVTLIFDGVDITCEIAPAVIFYNVYEYARTDDPTGEGDPSDSGARIVIADGSENNIDGAYVAKIYKDNPDGEKLHKYDGALYSKMSMSIDSGKEGTGVLNINGAKEGLNSEMHLNVNGGNINITAMDDGINANEDGVSVITINGGNVTVKGGMGSEGDGIDSNGWLMINGGTLFVSGNGLTGDGGIDADKGIVIDGGTVAAFGSRNDAVLNSSEQTFVQLSFSSVRKAGSVIKFVDEQGYGMIAPSDREYQSVVLAGDNLDENKVYYLYVDDVIQEYTGSGSNVYVAPVNPGDIGGNIGRGDFGGKIDRGDFDDYMKFPEGFEKWLENDEDIPEEIREWLEELYRKYRKPDAEIPPQPKPRTDIMSSSEDENVINDSVLSLEALASVEFIITEEIRSFFGIGDSLSYNDK